MAGKDKKVDFFHSSAYGKAQSGGVMGSTSAESFNDRMKIDRNRTVVRRYDDSKLVALSKENGPRAKKYIPPEKSVDSRGDRGSFLGGNATKRAAQSANAPAVPKTNLGIKK